MTQSIGLMMEGLVAVLLLITIGFCVILNRKIGLLRADEHMLRTTITELNKTTVRAETAIKGLRAIATDANEALREQMAEAELLARDLARGNAYGEQVLQRMGVPARGASRPAAPKAQARAPQQQAPQQQASQQQQRPRPQAPAPQHEYAPAAVREPGRAAAPARPPAPRHRTRAA